MPRAAAVIETDAGRGTRSNRLPVQAYGQGNAVHTNPIQRLLLLERLRGHVWQGAAVHRAGVGCFEYLVLCYNKNIHCPVN